MLKTSLDKKHSIKSDLPCDISFVHAKIKMQLKTQVKVSKSTSEQLFSEAVTSLSGSILEELPKQKSIKKPSKIINELRVFQKYLII